jgi:hypothetical protein
VKINVTIREAFPSSIRPEELEAVHGGSKDNCVDADGHVPEYYGHYGNTRWAGWARTVPGSPCQRYILYNLDKMGRAGRNDWATLRAHEMAHTRGWDHGAGTPSTNPAYYPKFPLTGR